MDLFEHLQGRKRSKRLLYTDVLCSICQVIKAVSAFKFEEKGLVDLLERLHVL